MDRDGFLRRGWTRACLNDDGKIPSERERLTRFVMIGQFYPEMFLEKMQGLEKRQKRGCNCRYLQGESAINQSCLVGGGAWGC